MNSIDPAVPGKNASPAILTAASAAIFNRFAQRDFSFSLWKLKNKGDQQ